MLGDIIIRYASVASTNDEAKIRARFLPEGSVITALSQTRGKGRLGRAWESEGGGLYFSVVMKPRRRSDAPSLALAAGVAARRAIEEVASLRPLLKWPNDLLINDKKICGILLEARAGGAGPAEQGPVELICGIGVNVNNAGFSPEIAGKAASLFIEKGVRYSPDEVLYAILRHFDAVYRIWMAEGFAVLRDEYIANCVHFRGNREVTVCRGEDAPFSGFAEGVADDGGLIVVRGAAAADDAGPAVIRTRERVVVSSGEVYQ